MSYLIKLMSLVIDRLQNSEQRARDAWLAESGDIFELERRQQQLNRNTSSWN